MSTRPPGEGGGEVLYQRLIFPGHTLGDRKGRGSPLMRHVIGLVAILGLCAGLYLYMAFIQTTPQCALENHHGAANCPVQLLRWYPTSKVEKW